MTENKHYNNCKYTMDNMHWTNAHVSMRLILITQLKWLVNQSLYTDTH